MSAIPVPPGGTAPALRYRRVPWSPRGWLRALYQTGAIPAQLAAPVVPYVLLVGLKHMLGPHWLGPMRPERLAAVALVSVVVVFLALPALTWVQCQRLRATAGLVISPLPAIPDWPSPDGFATAVRSPAAWRQFAYHVLAAPALAVGAAIAFGMWLVGLLYALVYAYAWRLPRQGLLYRGMGLSASLPRVLDVPVDCYLTLAGLGLLAAAPWVTAWVRELDVRVAHALLGPSRAEELEHRVEHLTQTRAGVVDAADAERRRLERDLHDGTQQRLVSLAINLGIARAQASTAEAASEAIAEAHEEAKAALAELRDLIRGLHPAVLEDRGLDAALSGVAARMPLPVRLTVDLPRRPPAVIEAVAYFVVSEGLANIAKHAQASQAEVFVQRTRDRLHIIISDDGAGGADPARGTGLAGLARRAASVDGTLEITSPPGGPTLLTVDLPCVR
jgi:signal transduction histidine kinase